MKTRLAVYCVIALLVLLDFSGVARAATPGQLSRLGYQAGDDWEPAIAADRQGHVYVLWPHFLGVPGCTACPSPTMLLPIPPVRVRLGPVQLPLSCKPPER